MAVVYVFDCRSTHNPGRYEPYKKITGLDEAVIRFLEDDGEIVEFLRPVYELADHHVERLYAAWFHKPYVFVRVHGEDNTVPYIVLNIWQNI